MESDTYATFVKKQINKALFKSECSMQVFSYFHRYMECVDICSFALNKHLKTYLNFTGEKNAQQH